MHILLVGPDIPFGGFGRFVNDFRSAKLPIELTLYNTARSLKKSVKSYKIGTHASIVNAGWMRLIKSVFITFFRFAIFPYRLLRIRPDIVYCVVGGNVPFWDVCPYALASWGSRCKIVFHWLGPLEPFYLHSGIVIRWIVHTVLRRVGVSIVLTRNDEKLLSKIAPTKPVVYIPSSVNIVDYEDAQPGDLLPRIDNLMYILFLGGVDPFRKGLPTLLDSLPLIIARAERPIRLVVTGSVSSRQMIECLDPTIRSHCVYLGWIKESDKPGLYKACNLAVLPSFDEGMPYSLVEAMAAGLPIVSTHVGGIPDVVRDGVNGFLVLPGKHIELADRILQLVNDPMRCRMISEENRQTAKKKYSLSAMFERIVDLCKVLLRPE